MTVCGLELVKASGCWPGAWTGFLSLKGSAKPQLALTHGCHPSQSSLIPFLLNFMEQKNGNSLQGLPLLVAHRAWQIQSSLVWG